MPATLVTIESCVDEARLLKKHLASVPVSRRQRHLMHIFTHLADNDDTVGRLAYYLWRRRFHRLR